jgi:hypothetical protein
LRQRLGCESVLTLAAVDRESVLNDLESRANANAGTMAADRVVVEWIGPGTGPFMARKRDFEFIVDEPLERGGTDTAPNPVLCDRPEHGQQEAAGANAHPRAMTPYAAT